MNPEMMADLVAARLEDDRRRAAEHRMARSARRARRLRRRALRDQS